ncbi:DUF2474 family protein [Luteibacter aegosomatissinici]|nr:DUF2474 family protein [Luteibacter aegosomatissinici]UPG92636.1 DUF2474 family protein [Luteibacter aegosomatissinici]
MARGPESFVRRAAWFVALYVGGVVAVAIIALAFRVLMPH